MGKRETIFVFVIALIVMLFLTYFMVKILDNIMSRFEAEAKEYLGTDKFRIESYWWNRLIYTAASCGVITVFALILLLFVDWYAKREEKRRG